ncbi:LPS export ABC transporter periplasmic protein LptC [Thermosulfuriphilus sp.]
MLSYGRVLLLLSLLFCFWSCSLNQETPPPQRDEESPDIILKDVEFVEYRGEKTGYTVLAIRASLLEKQGLLRLKKVEITSGDKDDFFVRGDKGWYDLKEEKLFLEGSVMIKTRDRGTLRTKSLLYLPQEDRLVGEKEVFIEAEDLRIKGVGFVYEINKGRLKICHQVEMIGEDFI